MSKIVYLSNPYGFSGQQKNLLLPVLIEKLKSMDLEVWEPFDRNNRKVFDDPHWAYEVGQKNFKSIANANGFIAVVNGCPPDEGVMVELGIASALQKPIFFFRDDFRRCAGNNKYPLNLMLFVGLPKIGWDRCFYASVEELSNETKALFHWAQEE